MIRYPNHLPPKSGERVGLWVERFKERQPGNGLPPNELDFLSHGKFHGVSFRELFDETNTLAGRERILSILAETFPPCDYFVTHYLTVWFTTNEQAVTFRLIAD